jgi:two-component system cell cycle sensor histidine kinase/response regulator CckA
MTEGYHEIVENANDLILTVDLGGAVIGANRAVERTLGYDAGTLVGKPVSSLIAPEWRAQAEHATNAKIDGRTERTVYELELVAQDGRKVPVEVSSWLVYDGEEPVAAHAICRDVSERDAAERARQEAEDALLERDDLLQRAFETTAIGMAIVSASGRIVRPNRAYCELLGYTPDELLSLDADAVTHPDDRKATAETIRRLVEGEVPRLAVEKRYVRKDGEVIWAQVGVSPVRSRKGKVTSLIAQVVDVTARREAESALRDSEELFRAAFEGAAAGMLLVTPHGNIVRANAEFCRIVGYDLAELRRMDVLELTHPEDRREVRSALARSDDPIPYIDDKRYVRKDGDPVWVHVAASPVFGPHGNLRGYVTQVTDLTARRASEERFRLLFESSPLGIEMFDGAGRVVAANGALLRMLGYEADELRGKHWRDFTHPDDRDLDLDRFGEMFAHRRSHHELEKRYLHKDGHAVLVRLTAFAPDDAEQFLIGVVEDITERRELEEQLRRAQRMEAVGQLAGGVAHDFNNLLTAIVSYCDLAAGSLPENADERVRSSIDGIRGAADRASDLTRQLLAFGRRQVLELEPVDVNAVIAEHASMLARLIGEDVDVRLALDPDASTVTMDKGQLVQVLMNLAVNARDAMPSGGTLTIETENVELDRAPTTTGIVSGPHVLVAVSDTGAGMDAETTRRIFEPFFTTKEPGKGTGLGLSTVLGIVEQSGGRVSVYSEPGVGTTFKTYLPAVGTAPRPSAAPAPVARPTGAERILLVEDNDAVRDPLCSLLADLGYDVVAAAGPVGALTLADADEIDLLVTDVVMPAMNGRELAEALRPGHPEMKVLYISGYTDDAVIARGIVQPGIAFLQKPFGADRLAAKVRELLDA